MAYGGAFPVNYGQLYPQIPQQAQSQNNNMIWVQGEAGAKSYLVAPNNTVTLWDSEKQTIYLKSADAAGMPSMKVLDYTIRENANKASNMPLNNKGEEYVTKEELEAFRGEITQIINNVKETLGA